MHPSLRFDGWDSAEGWIRALPEADADAWTYLTIVDRTSREAEITIGRRAREESPDPFQNGPDDLVQWVREQAIGNAIGSSRTVYRVRAWTVKGQVAAIGSRQFVVADDSAPEAVDAFASMTPGQAEAHATVSGLRHLGDHYKQFGETVLATFKGFAEIHALTSQQLSGELNIQRGQALSLFRAQLQDKRETTEQEAMLQIHAADAKVKEVAINRGLGLLEAVGRMLAPDQGAGVPQELQPVLQIVGSSPELSSALKDPKILKLLRDPTAQAGLAQILAELSAEAPADVPHPDPFAAAESPQPEPLRVVPEQPKPDVHPSLATAEPTILVAGDVPQEES